ncbi:MAG: hypothetical protein U1C48_03660 [Methylotenera sp.]|nr:hypothetical protein [Methylotenera sp.]
METIIGVLFLLFMFLVDWRLNKIYKELKSLNVTMGKAHSEQAVGATIHESPPSSVKQMEENGITFDGEHYSYGEYKYDRLSDAISYAKLQKQ